MYNYNMGYKIMWETFYGTTQSNDTLKSDGASGFTDRTAYSKSKLGVGTDGWVEWIYKPSEITSIVGFLDSAMASSSVSHLDYDYALKVTSGNALSYWDGSSWTSVGTANENDVLRIERTSNVFYAKKNGTSIHSMAGINKDLTVKALINSSVLFNMATSFTTPSLSISSGTNNIHYAVLNRKLDAGYYNTVGSKVLYFKFDEEYFVPSSTNIDYKLYDDSGALVTGLSSLVEKIGDNRYSLSLSSLSSDTYYKLYVYNKKNEVWKARVKVN